MKFHSVPITVMHGEGWIKEYLKRQKEGITGHIEKCGKPFDTPNNLWETKEDAESWIPCEQQAYWVDGALKLSYLLDDEELKDKVRNIMAASITLADEDGYIGPDVLKTKKGDKTDAYMRWPHSVYFRALMTEVDADGEEGQKILSAMIDFYKKGTDFIANERNVCQIESVAWLYQKTGDAFFADYAERMFEAYQKQLEPGASLRVEEILSDRPFDMHGVTVCETMKLLPILYEITGKQKYLDIALAGVDKLIRQCLLVDGVISSEEFTRTNTSDMAHETCDIADFAWLLGYMFRVTGDITYLDLIERMTLNAAPAVVMPDFKAIQYFSSPNLTIADDSSAHCRYTRGMWTMSYRPYGYAACCIGNVNRIMPNYISKQWHEDEDGVLYATLYGPSVLQMPDMRITEKTEYPFSFDIIFCVETEKEVEKTLAFRIPKWAKGYRVFLNDEELSVSENNGFVSIAHTWMEKEVVKICFLAAPLVNKTADGGRYVDYGPILYAYEVPHDTECFMAAQQKCEFPSYSLRANGAWNYAMREDVIEQEGLQPVYTGSLGYLWEEPRICFEVPVEQIRGWVQNHTNTVDRWMYRPKNILLDDKFVYQKIEGDFTMTPGLPDEETLNRTRDHEIHRIKLIPYGCAKLRITIFPVVR